MSNTRNFTVRGVIDCRYMPPSGTVTETLENIEVQLWHQAPLEEIFLGTGLTDPQGQFAIDFSVESPVSYIQNGQIKDVFIKPFYKGELLISFEYDEDAQLYFNQLDPQPSSAFKVAVNNLIKHLKASGNWEKFDRLWIHATEHQQNATISLVQPATTPISEVNAPAWVSGEGYTGNGSTSYLNTNFNPAVQASRFATNSGCIFYYSRTNMQQGSVDMGNADATTGANSSALAPRLNSGQTQTRLQASTNGDGPDFTDTSGLLYVNRSQSNITTYGKNGLQIGSLAQPQTGIANANFFIGGTSQGTVLSFPSTRQIALAGVGSGTVDHYALYLAIQEFATAIGFNV